MYIVFPNIIANLMKKETKAKSSDKEFEKRKTAKFALKFHELASNI